MAVCTRQCSGWDWTRDCQSQVQRPNHYVPSCTLHCYILILYRVAKKV